MRFIACFVAIVVFIAPFQAFGLDTPESLGQEAEQTMKSGKALYETYMKGPLPDQETETAKLKIEDFCEFPYKAYGLEKAVYFIAEAPVPGGLVFGRHYKVSDSGVTKSTIACFVTPPPPDSAVAAYVTHLLTPTPTEFHVFLSLKHANPIYVRTEAGYWKVERGDITFVGKPK